MSRQVSDFDTTVAGIPCGIVITHCLVVDGDMSADNRDEFYGWRELDFEFVDRRGYPAKWLERKATKADYERIEDEYFKAINR